jgi:hypothetical protein
MADTVNFSQASTEWHKRMDIEIARGDAMTETDRPDPTEAAEAQLAFALDALRAVEWVPRSPGSDPARMMPGYVCAWCGAPNLGLRPTHKPDCLRQRAIGLDQR